MMAGVDMVHVPYRGEPQAIVDLMGGQLDIDFSTLAGFSANSSRAASCTHLQ